MMKLENQGTQEFVQVGVRRLLKADFDCLEDCRNRGMNEGGPCVIIHRLNNKPPIEITEPAEVRAIGEWFREQATAPGYLAIAPELLTTTKGQVMAMGAGGVTEASATGSAATGRTGRRGPKPGSRRRKPEEPRTPVQ
jgi:hypothetical protein